MPYWVSTAALVSCLGQPCFSKITYMVTACKYCKGLYSTVVYCAFFWFPLTDNLGSIPAIDIFFYFRDNSVSCQKLDRILWKFVRYVLSLSAIGEWGMHSRLWRKRLDIMSISSHLQLWCYVWNSCWIFNFFFQNVHLKSRVLYTDYLCKIIDQRQGLFNFDRFVYNFG